MAQIVFLDTNVILDCVEKRNQKVRDIIIQLLLFHRKGKIVLATSVFNIAELIDKDFEIQAISELIRERMSPDEINKRIRDRKLVREIAKKNKGKVEKQIKDFIFDNRIEMLTLSFESKEGREENQESKTYEDLYNLIYEHQFRSQDALIIATALSNGATYFLSNDNDIVFQINTIGLMDAFNLRDETHRKNFKNDVLETLVEVLR